MRRLHSSRPPQVGGEKWLVEDELPTQQQGTLNNPNFAVTSALPPNLQVFQHNYAAHLLNKGTPLRNAATVQAEEEAELTILEERKRRRTRVQRQDEDVTTAMEDAEESPTKLMKEFQGHPKNLAPAGLQDRYCQEE
ncbi:hypothetical protein LINGRAHAP2_LOCUS4197 [Linum grandiflorum]